MYQVTALMLGRCYPTRLPHGYPPESRNHRNKEVENANACRIVVHSGEAGFLLDFADLCAIFYVYGILETCCNFQPERRCWQIRFSLTKTYKHRRFTKWTFLLTIISVLW